MSDAAADIALDTSLSADQGTEPAAAPQAVPAAVSEAQWVRWWCTPWNDAHTSWKQSFAEQAGVPLPACEAWAGHRPQAFLAFAGVYPPQPPPPVPQVLQWLSMTATQQQLALSLVTYICNGPPPTEAEDLPAQPHLAWCRSLAKALRPGLWLESEKTEAPTLLGGWLGPQCWARLRLAWPRSGTLAASDQTAFTALATARLNTLWPAVLWRVEAR